MTIEIKEIVIRTSVKEDAAPGNRAKTFETTADQGELKREIMEECREMVIQLLQEERER